MLHKEIDLSNLGNSDLNRTCMSCPSRMESSSVKVQAKTVPRQSRISFELYPDILEVDEEDLSCDSDNEDDGDFEDPLDILLAKLNVKPTQVCG